MGSRRGKGGVLYGGLERARGGPIELLQRGGGGLDCQGRGLGGSIGFGLVKTAVEGVFGQKWLKIGLFWLKLAKNGKKWQKIAKNSKK